MASPSLRTTIVRLLLLGTGPRSPVLVRLMSCLAFRKLIGRDARLLVYRHLGARIGKDVYIGARTSIRFPENVVIGDGSVVAAATIEAWGEVIIGRDVMINHNVYLFTAQHEIDSPTFDGEIGVIHIGDHAWLPYHIYVLPDVHIGRCAVIGTGSVVTRDVPEYGVAAGNPARVVKTRARVAYTYRASRIGR
jgi:acetyltransferase-like isoleucine patch superfamily enzyme